MVNFRPIFARTKDEIRRISLSFILHKKKINPVRLINFQRMGAKSEKGSWTNGASKYSGYTNLRVTNLL